MPDDDGSAARWRDELYDLLRRHNVTQFAYCRMPATAS